MQLGLYGINRRRTHIVWKHWVRKYGIRGSNFLQYGLMEYCFTYFFSLLYSATYIHQNRLGVGPSLNTPGGAVASDRASDLRSSSRGFEARPRRCCATTTLSKLFTPYCLCHCHRYVFVDLAEASSRVLVDTALWFTVSEARDWSDSRAWRPFCLAR